MLFLTGRLAEAENLLRPILEEHPRLWRAWPRLVQVVLAKGDREEARRIFDHVADVETLAPDSRNKALAQSRILMHLGDRAGAVQLIRPYFLGRQRRFLDTLLKLHTFDPVPQSMADYAPFQELVGWPPPLPN